jgi:hydroxyacylglutathione hydrolase
MTLYLIPSIDLFMQLKQIYMENSLQNYNYFVYSEINQKAIFFDPFDIDKTFPIAKELGLEVIGLMNTHHHYDHIKDNEKLLQQTSAELIELADGEVYHLSATETVRAIYTPGHIDPHFCFVLGDDRGEWGVICGDLIFNGGVGNTRNGGDVDVLANTIIDQVQSWDEKLKIYPSHDYMQTNLNFAKTIESNPLIDKWMSKKEEVGRYLVTSLKDEKEFNPFLRTTDKKTFKEIREKRNNW